MEPLHRIENKHVNFYQGVKKYGEKKLKDKN